jgi:hypothetical protein
LVRGTGDPIEKAKIRAGKQDVRKQQGVHYEEWI